VHVFLRLQKIHIPYSFIDAKTVVNLGFRPSELNKTIEYKQDGNRINADDVEW
jgi:hypothetical protein